MKITKVNITAGEWGKTKAMVSVEFDKCFVVGGLKIIEGSSGYFVSMPNRKLADGTYKDTCFPITKEFREELIKTILNKFSEKEIEEDDSSSDSFPF
jgi:stage V sporulation protein G